MYDFMSALTISRLLLLFVAGMYKEFCVVLQYNEVRTNHTKLSLSRSLSLF